MSNELNKDAMLNCELLISQCRAEFFINDIPLYYLNGVNRSVMINAHHLLINGENTARLSVFPADIPSGFALPRVFKEGEPQNQSYAKMRLAKYQVGEMSGNPTPQNVLMELTFDLEKTPIANEEELNKLPPLTAKTQFNSPFPIWCWESCPILDLESELENIHHLAEHIYTQFNLGNAQAIVDLCAPVLRDLGIALPAYGEANFRKDMMRDITSNSATADKFEPYSRDKTDFRLCANGRMVQLINKDWSHTITTPLGEDGEPYDLPVFLGKYRGKWAVVM